MCHLMDTHTFWIWDIFYSLNYLQDKMQHYRKLRPLEEIWDEANIASTPWTTTYTTYGKNIFLTMLQVISAVTGLP